jgi:hypothetical protein
MSKLEKIKNWFLCFSLLIIIFGGSYLFYLSSIDGIFVNKPYTYDNTIFITNKLEYRAGDQLTGKWKFCKNIDASPTINWSFVDDLVFNLPAHYGVLSRGCYNQEIFISEIPASLYPGKYHMAGRVEIRVNPLRTITFEVSTNNFTIVK